MSSGSAKSSGVSESSGSSGSSELDSSSSGSLGSGESSGSSNGSSSGSSSSSSCHCAFEVSEITLTSGTTGFYKVTNTGCGEVLVVAHLSDGYTEVRDPPFALQEGETLTVEVEATQDIRITQFTVVTDCSEQIHMWPDWP